MHSCCPNLSTSVPSVSTCSTALLSSTQTYNDVNLNAVNVFEPMGYSPIPTDICLVGNNNNSIDKFNTQDQLPVYNTDDPAQSQYPVDYDNSPCKVTDTYDWQDNSVNDVCALIDTGAMVTCT